MRLHFKLSSNQNSLPFDYQHKLMGVFHKWMGWNDIHDEISLYSFSWLQGITNVNGGLDFPRGARWFISVWDEQTAKILIKNAMDAPELFNGMEVLEINIQNDPEFEDRQRFLAASPVFIRKYEENKAIHLLPDDKDAGKLLTATLQRKLNKAQISADVNIRFDEDYYNPKTKLITINGVKNRASLCPVIVEGDPEAVRFAWNVGVGHSTGCGFGSLY